jgi:hypothetical protein
MVVTEFDNEKPVIADSLKVLLPMVVTQSPTSMYLIVESAAVCDAKSPLVIADVASHSALNVDASEKTALNFIPVGVGGVGVSPLHTRLPPQAYILLMV